jgi:hypothetical protein
MGMDPKRNRAVESHLSKDAKGGAPGYTRLQRAPYFGCGKASLRLEFEVREDSSGPQK